MTSDLQITNFPVEKTLLDTITKKETAMDLSKKKEITYSISNIISKPSKNEKNYTSPHIMLPKMSPNLPRLITPPSDDLSGSGVTILNVNNPLMRPCSPEDGQVPNMQIQRPFKAFTQNKLFDMSDVMLDLDSNPEYIAFRKALLNNQQKNNRTNSNMRRNITTGKYDSTKDPEYLEKRRRNNIAAKKSRDARRNKEDELAVRCAFLEKENNKLRFYVQHLEQRLQSFPYVL